MRKIIVVNNPTSWKLESGDLEIISSVQYIEQPEFGKSKNVRVFNLCNDYAYQTKGYYVSLLAEARGQKVIPSVKNILDLKGSTIIKTVSEELDALIQKSLKPLKGEEFVLSIYFGRNVAKHYNKLAHELQKLFQAPFIRARFVKGKKWELKSVRPIPFKEIPEHHFPYVNEFAQKYFGQKRYNKPKDEKYLYDLAILVNPDEKAPPSDQEALVKFEQAAKRLGCYVDFITRDDYNRLNEYDALFIRETTSVNHYTYRFARRAQAEGLAVLDTPEAILKCANKVYLTEVLNVAKIPIPKTAIVSTRNLKMVEQEIGFPCVLKLPDSSFSMGVEKVESHEELMEKSKLMLKQSDLLLVQAFMPTDFDWRIGILNNEIIFGCKYYMAKDHWQIYNWSSENAADVSGGFENVPVEDIPGFIAEQALKATRLIGNGLFGVDIKEINGQSYIIEINDNPNVDADVEDLSLKDQLYDKIISYLISQISTV